MTTITIKKSSSTWEKTDFSDDGDLLDYLLENYQIGRLYTLSEKELTVQRKKDWQDVEQMGKDDFIDIR